MLVSIDTVKAGMVLQEDVLLPNGAILVNASAVLSDKLIETLKRRNIAEIMIQTEEKQNRKADEVKSSSSPAQQSGSSKPSEPQKPKEEPPTPPKITVIFSDDCLSAKLRFETAGGKNETVSFEEALRILRQQELDSGLDDKKIRACVDKWNKDKKPFEMDGIAKGQAPTPGKEGELHIEKKYIANEESLNTARKASVWYQLAAAKIDVDRVDPATIVARRELALPAVPGKNVKGELVHTEEIIKKPVVLDGQLTFSADGEEVTAQATGILYFVNNNLGLLTLEFNGSVDCSIDSTGMKAEVIAYPAGPGGKLGTERDIRSLLSQRNVCHGIKEDAIKSLVADLIKGKVPESPVAIAEGAPAINGENGKVQFLFPTETSLKPKVNPDGSVDYKNVDIVHAVSKDEELARLIAPTRGTPGKSVLGKELKCTDGAPTKLPVGANTALHPQKPDVLIATTEGNVKWNGVVVEISEGYVIRGDVDFSTGNIHYGKSVQIGGDIKGGFDVECGGDLQIAGTVEDCKITVGGNVLSKHGFIGTGKGIIDAKGDVNIGFIKNQIVRSRKGVSIAKEALNCTIYARHDIIVHGNPISVAGGMLVARDSITVYSVGNNSQIKTTLEVGLDFTLVEEMKKTEASITEIEDNKKKLREPLNKYDQLLKIKRKLPPKEELLYLKLKTTLEKYDLQIKQLEDRKKMIAQKMYAVDKAYIKIERSAMPGTVFKIGERFFAVHEEIIGPKIVRMIEFQIRVT